LRADLQFPAEGGLLYIQPQRSQTKVAEGLAAVRLAAFLGAAGVPVAATESRLLDWQQLRDENVIVIGRQDTNRWVPTLLADLPMRALPAGEGRPRRLVDTRAGAGEPRELPTPAAAPGVGARPAAPQNEQFALITFMPGPGGRRPLVVISGTSSQSLDSAAHFLSDEASLAALVRALRGQAPAHRGAWHFQAVVRLRVRDRVPMAGELLRVRAL
jgi:hypothetical protein